MKHGNDRKSSADRLRALLSKGEVLPMPGCFDAISASLVGEAGFPLAFMSGFCVSASRLGMPDTGMISYAEMLDQGRNLCQAACVPVIGDGDTGYGNAINVKRTVRGYAAAGFAAIMIEDQVTPKRCGHTQGKAVVEREEAFTRIQAAIDARNEGADILILARTDARYSRGLDEALARAQRFHDMGADLLLVEAPRNEAEMVRVCEELPGHKVINLIAGGSTPILPYDELGSMGYSIVNYSVTMLSVAIRAMRESLREMADRKHPYHRLLDFAELRHVVGFDSYAEEETRYSGSG